jgi:SAM-dependent methyltransferase
MDTEHSSWIPRSRIRVATGSALVFAVTAIAGSLWSPFTLLLLVPALGLGWVSYILLRIRRQLSPAGGGWERRIHEAVVERLAVPPESTAATLDIGCGDASLLIALLRQAPKLIATGVDYWGANWDYAQAGCEERLAGLALAAIFRRMDAARLEFPDDTFDFITSVMCFHEVQAAEGDRMRGPLVALSEALRVLRPGGRFVLVDRFGDAGDFGDPADLTAMLATLEDLRREPLVATLGIPWPLSSKRSLGPVDILSGRKPGQANCRPSQLP